MKDGISKLAMKSPLYIPGPVQPNFGPGRYLYFEGLYTLSYNLGRYNKTDDAQKL